MTLAIPLDLVFALTPFVILAVLRLLDDESGYAMFSSSTSNTSVARGGMMPARPWSP